MILDKEFQCQTCQYIMSHPVDACPVCNAQFYWMLAPYDPLDPSGVAHFITKMEMAVEGRTTREFLTHGGQLWLPHNFWDYNPDGEVLKEFPWIRHVRFLQHEGEGQVQSPSVYETNPGMSLASFQESAGVEAFSPEPGPVLENESGPQSGAGFSSPSVSPEKIDVSRGKRPKKVQRKGSTAKVKSPLFRPDSLRLS